MVLDWYLHPSVQSSHRSSLWFFPLVSAYATVIMPLTIYSFMFADGLPGLQDRTGHAYEMFFGLGLGLVAGYLLGRQKLYMLLALMGSWMLARVSHLWLPWSLPALGIQGLFTVLMLSQLVPRLRVAKRWRNRMLVPLLTALLLLPLAAVTAAVKTTSWSFHWETAGSSLLLFSLLMSYMGGRAIAPAAAAAHHQRKYELAARVQPRIEAWLIIVIGLAALLLPFVDSWLTGVLSGVAGMLVLYRLGRWRLWPVRRHADLICMGVGYAWLGLGLLVFGVYQMLSLPPTAALHFITVGALGTLSTGMMARVVLRRTLKVAPPPIGLVLITASIAFSALARFGADLDLWLVRDLWLRLSVVAWSTAYAGLTVWLVTALIYGGASKDKTLKP
ncbi:MAG: NnrS family protein [Saccharospirillum sp.]|nr:NnrS family protein [Saccharospirillum sp.]